MHSEEQYERELLITKGFSELKDVFEKYAENLENVRFGDEEADSQTFAANPKAFSVTTEIDNIDLAHAKTAILLNDLFEKTPKAKIVRISITPALNLTRDFTPAIDGGTITINGIF